MTKKRNLRIIDILAEIDRRAKEHKSKYNREETWALLDLKNWIYERSKNGVVV